MRSKANSFLVLALVLGATFLAASFAEAEDPSDLATRVAVLDAKLMKLKHDFKRQMAVHAKEENDVKYEFESQRKKLKTMTSHAMHLEKKCEALNYRVTALETLLRGVMRLPVGTDGRATLRFNAINLQLAGGKLSTSD